MNALKNFLPDTRDTVILLFATGILVGIALSGAIVSINPHSQPAASLFVYTFNSPGVLNEEGSMQESPSPYWWVNSGGELLISGDTGSTMQGAAPAGSRWQTLYASDNPVDTDQGAHPQNIFRLVTKESWQSVGEQADFLILKDNFSASPNRNASNGLLLMSRYADAGQTLYYAGIRVDGTAVIKKKYKGTYYTMAQQAVFPGAYRDTQDNKNLIPHNEWISLRSETVNNADGSVTVSLYMKRAGESAWTKLLEAGDTGQYGSTPPITAAGYAGIRTDFMDVRFENYRLNKI